MSVHHPHSTRNVSSSPPGFAPLEIGIALLIGVTVEVLMLVGMASVSHTRVIAIQEKTERAIPIAVKPVLDELPLLKLGSKRRPKLPEMWRVKPKPIKRKEAKSAPSPEAEDDVEKIPESELADLDASAPEPDADIAKEVEEELEDDPDASTDEPEMEEEGSPDGVAEGTETDPMKARQVSLYRRKISGWFSRHFSPPVVPCDQVARLRVSVSVSVGGDRSITGFSIGSQTGNAAFDAQVRQTMNRVKGKQLPPPPKLYPDILGTTIATAFAAKKSNCKKSSAPPPKDTTPPPSSPEAAPEKPAPKPPADPAPTPPAPKEEGAP